ncbi:MAG: SMEK domain-containing protein, partial [Verrucomicrobiales bacterium]|nr:SMEK domain-containing protein [Verrucomicrobiales bacterium]
MPEFRSEEVLDDLKEWFSRLSYSMEGNKALKHQNANIRLEDFFCELLSKVFKWNLQNANGLIDSNQDSFDLVDDSIKTVVQVTVTTSTGKIQKTLSTFRKKKHHDSYTLLKFAYPVMDAPTTKAKFKKEKGDFDFDAKRDRIDFNSILKEVSNRDLVDQEEILNLVKHHLTPLGRALNDVADSILPQVYPTEMIDRETKEQTQTLLKGRFYPDFDRIQYAISLGDRVANGSLYGGTDTTKSRALAACARILSREDDPDLAKSLLTQAKKLSTVPEIEIAEAFIKSHQGDKRSALQGLAKLDTPFSKTAALMVVMYHDGCEKALDWVEDAGYSIADFDSEGKYLTTTLQHTLSRWDDASTTLELITPEDFDSTPILYYLTGINHVLSVSPQDLRSRIVNDGVPFYAADFPLAESSSSFVKRNKAIEMFSEAARVAKELNREESEALAEDFVLWLELRDPKHSESAKTRLSAKFREPSIPLHLIPIAFQFGLGLKVKIVEKEIQQQTALTGGMTLGGAKARLALAFLQKDSKSAAEYCTKHYEELSQFLGSSFISSIQVELYARAGRVEMATESFDKIRNEGISENEERRLKGLIDEAKGKSSISIRKALYEESKELVDLAALVGELEEKNQWDQVTHYGELLFNETGTISDLERLVQALFRDKQYENIVSILTKRSDLMANSEELRMTYCWSSFQEGNIIEAKRQLNTLMTNFTSSNARTLHVNIAIALGDWNSLASFVINELDQKANRTPKELIFAAQLALQLSNPVAKDLIFTAAENCENDAEIFAGAYFLATKAGWENLPEVNVWLQKAVKLSGESGPIRPMTLSDIYDHQTDWIRSEAEITDMLVKAEAPTLLAARFLNKPLFDLTIFPALANSATVDPRQIVAVPGFCGNRIVSLIAPDEIIGLDPTALVTLSFLGVLDKVLDNFDKISISHSTLAWLFKEKQNINFHQPSRIRDAHNLAHLVSTNQLVKFTEYQCWRSDLDLMVGTELATFIREAIQNNEDTDIQHLVVKSSPVHIVGSRMSEIADLSAYDEVLCSCSGIVRKLRNTVQLTLSEENDAIAYLQLQEQPWPNEPSIEDGAILYLDDVAASHLLHLEVLSKLKSAGLKAFVSEDLVLEANSFITFEKSVEQALEIIERVRAPISNRVQSGKIKVSKANRQTESDNADIIDKSMADIFSLAVSTKTRASSENLNFRHII